MQRESVLPWRKVYMHQACQEEAYACALTAQCCSMTVLQRGSDKRMELRVRACGQQVLAALSIHLVACACVEAGRLSAVTPLYVWNLCQNHVVFV